MILILQMILGGFLISINNFPQNYYLIKFFQTAYFQVSVDQFIFLSLKIKKKSIFSQ